MLSRAVFQHHAARPREPSYPAGVDSPRDGWIRHRPYVPPDGAETAARRFYEIVRQRRTVRMFSDRPVSRDVIAHCVLAAGTAPSGANKQPWRFVAVDDPAIKREIRSAAEAEEREFYTRRATPEWLADLAPLGTDEHKPFLELAPWLIAVFKLVKTDPDRSGRHRQVYYTSESVGLAAGLLLTALHHAGLATLTHTPSPMGFLGKILRRPDHERPFLLIPVGYPADDCIVPDIARKPLDDILVWNRP
jgi:iodotyrosine deiodinase